MTTANTNEDKLVLGGHEFTSRFILGSGKFSLELVKACIEKAGTQIVTLALRRANEGGLANILDYVPKDVTLLPNTSGARNAQEAVRIARLSRELGCGDFVKIEVIHDSKYLLPDNYETIKATEILAKEGFVVMPYMYPDLNAARDLVNAGAACVMPLGSPIGSNKGICTKEFIQILIDEINVGNLRHQLQHIAVILDVDAVGDGHLRNRFCCLGVLGAYGYFQVSPVHGGSFLTRFVPSIIAGDVKNLNSLRELFA